MDDSWVARSYNEGLRQGFRDAMWDAVDPFGLHEYLVAGTVTTAAKDLRIAGRWASTLARRARNFHHAFPKFFAGLLGKSSKVLVHMPAAMHQQYHAFLDKALRHRLGCPSMYDSRGMGHWAKWIADNPEGARQIIPAIREATANFAKSHQIKGLLEALDEAVGMAPLK